MNQQLKISVLQHNPTPDDIEASHSRIAAYLSEAANSGSELLVVPEASLTGYNLPLAQAQSIALTQSADSHAFLQEQCKALKTGLAYGYIEREGDTLYNAVQVLDESGERLSHYRKAHLWGDLDRTLFSEGNTLTSVVNFKGWKLGVLICYDVEFPESVRTLALAGAELIVVPTALMHPFQFVADYMVPTRASESQLFIAYANYCGNENGLNYLGHSCIVSATGEDLARATDSPVLLHATLERQTLDTIRRELPYLANRRTELYSSLTK